MKTTVIFILLFLSSGLFSQTVAGLWKNIEKGKVQSHIRVFEKEGMLYAEVVELFPHSKVKICKKCKGTDKGKSLIGMYIFHDLKKDGGKWDNGRILNPRKGKKYDCQVELIDPNTLKVRGYVGNVLFGKSFFWHRVE